MPLVVELDYADYPLLKPADIRRMVWYSEITVPQGTIDQVLGWCRSQTEDDWRWHFLDYGYQEVTYRFFFVSKTDYLLFLLNWV